MKSLAKFVYLALACLMLGACATGGQKYGEMTKSVPAVPQGEGRIYIYRATALGMAVQPEVKLNGEVVGRAQPNGFFYVDRKPGPYEITTTTEVERKLSLTLEPGQLRFVRLGISMGFFVGHVYPELVDSDVGEKEIRDLTYIGK